MGIAFKKAHGSAIKSGLEYIKLDFGENRFRMVGDILPRYAYWRKLKTNSIPVECLAFNREKEAFDNLEKDWFRHYFPTTIRDGKTVQNNPTWSYVCQVIDPKDNKLKLCGLKKKLFDQIQTVADTLGDPTDPEEGYTLVVNKKKTGPAVYNVEYELLQLKLEPISLTEEELELCKDMKPIDELVPRPTADEQHAFIKQAWLSDDEEEETNTDHEAISELG